MSQAIELKITGKVQGVGFRPFVFMLAQELGLKGHVFNDSAGVTIRLFQPENLPLFLKRLKEELPPLAKIDQLSQAPFFWDGNEPCDFSIQFSQGGTGSSDILADVATCSDCLREMNDPTDRRYRYPFLNCTNCGPRFTIIKDMPYDRPQTSMAGFPLCKACAEEYADPSNRRFHAQPVACPECGPEISLFISHDLSIFKGEKALQSAISALKEGKILAIKGLGGFHLACLATEDAPITRLRERKHRPSKPFAVMLPNQGWLSKICAENMLFSEVEALLKSPSAPIVLVKKNKKRLLSSLIAPHLEEIGIMLPANPLQHLLLEGVGLPCVMTSGNKSGFAPALSNQAALEQLKDIADLFLFHDREILERADDSVLRFHAQGKKEILRRARGLAPDALMVPEGFPKDKTILALGGDLKNSFCLLHHDKIFTGPHFGDLNQGNVFEQWEKMLAKFPKLYHASPEIIALDAHPGYRSHQWGKEQTLPSVEIYHHHAHIATCLGENHRPLLGGKIIALTLDGLGYGEKGEIWGGECFLADYKNFQHLGGLPPVPLLGGDLAAKEPWRNLLAQFHQFVPDWERLPEAEEIKKHPYPILLNALKAGINAPLASSCGRFFEAVSAALGIAPQRQTYEGEAACLLESLAWQAEECVHPVKLPLKGTSFDLEIFWQSLLNWKAGKAEKAWAFHDALAKGFADLAKDSARKHHLTDVMLSGGCLHNLLLKERLEKHLHPLKILTHSELPSGDGGISVGQALIALANLEKDNK
ncbi:carbamoyltransferase HypF [Acetobacteraceae bacterium]|nr:carbamoyltransferase HypF [Acetobacteraceae bacterium]